MGNYEIVRLLARGGMAVVYLVRQPALDREVVLKRLDIESDDPAMAHVHKRPPPLEELGGPGHAAVCGWVEWLLAKDRAARPQSAGEAWDSLEEVAVAEMGPNWRRTATITAPVPRVPRAPADEEPPTTEEGGPPDKEQTASSPPPTPLAPAPSVPPHRPRRRAVGLATAALLAGAAAGGGLTPEDRKLGHARRRPPRPSAARSRTTSTATAARSW